jgi:hypothetical protein
MSPAQAGEAREINFGGDQFTSMSDRERGEIRIGHEWAADICAQRRENIPMAPAGNDLAASGRRGARPVQLAG